MHTAQPTVCMSVFMHCESCEDAYILAVCPYILMLVLDPWIFCDTSVVEELLNKVTRRASGNTVTSDLIVKPELLFFVFVLMVTRTIVVASGSSGTPFPVWGSDMKCIPCCV